MACCSPNWLRLTAIKRQLEESSSTVVCRNGICAMGGRGRNNSNERQRGSPHQRNEPASRRSDVSIRDETLIVVI